MLLRTISSLALAVALGPAAGQPVLFENHDLTNLRENSDLTPIGVTDDGLLVAASSGFSSPVPEDRSTVVQFFDHETGAVVRTLAISDQPPPPLAWRWGPPFRINADRLALRTGESRTVSPFTWRPFVDIVDIETGDLRLRLESPNGPDDDDFGIAIEFTEGLVVIAGSDESLAPGHTDVYYVFDAQTGDHLRTITPSLDDIDSRFLRGASGRWIVFSQSGADIFGFRSGAVSIYDLHTGEWLRRIVPADGAEGDRFGFPIGVQGSVAAIGAREDDDDGFETGSVYLYDLLTGDLIRKLNAPDPEIAAYFGGSLSIDGGYVAVGASRRNGTAVDEGTVYIFDLHGTCVAKLVASDAQLYDLLGELVVLRGQHVLAAMARLFRDDDDTATYAFTFDATWCGTADLAPPVGVLDLFDIDAFIGAYNAGAGTADLAPPFGTLDLGDIDAVIASFITGCP